MNTRTATTTIAMRDKIRAYSARPWPSSQLRVEDKAPSKHLEGPAVGVREMERRPSDEVRGRSYVPGLSRASCQVGSAAPAGLAP